MRDFLRITIPIFAAGALAFWWAGRRVSADVRRARWIKFSTYVVIVHGVLAAAIAGRSAIVALMAAIAAAGAVEIITASRRISRHLAVVIPLVFFAIAAGAIAFGLSAAPTFVAYVYLVVAAFDGFSQAGGQLAGRRRLARTISPGKTVEGLFIGISGALVCAILFRGALSLSIASALTFAVIASAAGLAGDLAASWVKRRARIKDYGTLLPGHGGVLDRFDSFLAVATVMFLLRARP
ncbi:MAG TPA: phosphatidate cytidylyltransferase [Vicinamibacterales bacterium]|jgi:phosphatidate cytidylyltransferase|nr:phosphatidate cytidylyltransferase [Vicinamibacterales bacterium]